MQSLENELVWFARLGIGYFPVKDTPYDESYFNKYAGYENTEIGQKINKARVDLYKQYGTGTVLDVGVGSGAFIKEIEGAKGFDINPAAVQWLKEFGRYSEISDFDCMTFWDSLEHIHNPGPVLKHAKKLVFVSCPIYKDKYHVLHSKHFRPDEHFWYWTKEGLQEFMMNFEFSLVESSNVESYLGREDIGTFVFKRL